MNSHRPKRRDPGRQGLPGSLERLFRGLPSGQPRNFCELRLTQYDFQDVRGRTAGIRWIPRDDFQRRALPHAKDCRLVTHRGAQSTRKVGRVNRFVDNVGVMSLDP
jgi:hypothetical protein